MSISTESPDNEGKNLWSNLLEEVRENTSVKLSPQRCLFVIGESESGKTTLISKLQGVEDISRSYGMEYQFIDVKDEDRDDHTKLGVYIMDGSLELSRLTKFALTKRNFSDCLGMIVVSMQEPWKIMDTLNNMYGTIRRHCDKLQLDDIERNQLKQSLIQHFQEYIEPNTAIDPTTGSYQPPLSTLPSSRRHLNPLHPPPSSSVNGLNNEESLTTPLPTDALKENVGLPLIVVVTKTDVIDTLEKEMNYDDEHIEIIQMHIRRFCLERGAALFYTSVKEGKNCELLKKYILHRVYGLPFLEPAYIVEKDCVFIPSGWDNLNKIKILEESLVKMKTKYHNFRECIPPPASLSDRSSRASLNSELVVAGDEQHFLEEIRDKIEKVQKNQSITGSGMDYNPNRSPSNRSTAAAAHVSAIKSRGYATTTNPNVQSGEGVLANFFNSLLKKTNSPNTVGNNTAPLTSTAQMNSTPVLDGAGTEKIAVNNIATGNGTVSPTGSTSSTSDVQQSVDVS